MKYCLFLYLFFLCTTVCIQNAKAGEANAHILQQIEKGIFLRDHLGDSSGCLFFLKALTESNERGYGEGIILSLENLAYEYSLRGDRVLSRYYSAECLQKAKKYNNLSHMATAWLLIGNTYQQDGSYDTSFNYYNSSATLAEKMLKGKITDSLRSVLESNLASVYCNVGLLMLRTERKDHVLYYFNLSETIARKIRFKRGLSNVLGYKALYYLNRNNIAEARKYADEALKISEHDSLVWPHQKALNVLGDVYSFSDPSKALGYYQLGVTLAKCYPNQQLYILAQMAALYLKADKTEQCKTTALSILAIAKTLNRSRYILTAQTMLANVYAREGNYKAAFNAQMQATEVKDKIAHEDNNSKLNLLEIKYRTAEKDKEIVQNKLLIAQQNNKLIHKNVLIVAACFIVIILLIVFIVSYWYRKRLFEQRITALKQREGLNNLLSIIKGEEKERSRLGRELHDGIGGMLSITRMYISNLGEKDLQLSASTDYKDVAKILDDTIIELRKMAHNLLPEQLMNLGLAEAVRAFCNTVQNANKISIDFQYHGADERFDVNMELLLYRTVQELVQNIIKHASATRALVQLSMYDSVFSITVEDNGIGMEDKGKEKGVGLELIKARVEQLNGHMNVRSGKGSGTSVYVELEII